MDRIVVVGLSVAGLTAAETLRRDGFAGELILVGDETHLPYDRPPLSKQVLKGLWEPSRTYLRTQDVLDALDARWHLGVRACGLDLMQRRVQLSDGRQVGFEGLVIATGVSPRRMPSGHGLSGVHTLRTLDDAVALRTRFAGRPRVVVVGAGFLGAEVAAIACELGLDVAMVDPLEAPMVRQLGPVPGALLAGLHRSHGVDLRLGVGVAGLAGTDGRVAGVRLTDGTTLQAGLVLVAIGCVPNTAWLAGSGLPVSDGVDCDEYGVAAPGVVAAGDVASWVHGVRGVRSRVEHRMNASEQGTQAARALLAAGTRFTAVPYFWSDQFDVRIQVYGTPGQDADFAIVAGDTGEGRFAGTFRTHGRVVAGLSWNMPREARRLRQLVLDDIGAVTAS